jgi:hypothetical protein
MTDTVAATAVRIECVIEGRFSLSQAQNFINKSSSPPVRIGKITIAIDTLEAPSRRVSHLYTSKEGAGTTSQVVPQNPTDAQWPRSADSPISWDMKMNTSASSSGEIRSYVQLQHQIHDALREQHPEWVEQNGDCPTCESYESRFAELLDIFQSNERKSAA